MSDGPFPPDGSASDRGDVPEIPDDEAEPVGIFPTWGRLYAVVIAWAAFLVLLLYLFTITFDYGAR